MGSFGGGAQALTQLRGELLTVYGFQGREGLLLLGVWAWSVDHAPADNFTSPNFMSLLLFFYNPLNLRSASHRHMEEELG